MTAQAASSITSAPLLQARNNLILHQALYAAAKLGVADLLNGGVCTTAELAGELKVNEEALYRTTDPAPGGVQGRILAKAGFVGEDQRPVLPLRFFSSSGQSSIIDHWEKSFTASRPGSQPGPSCWA
ncbi:MAG: hypothetical protein DMG40_01995 [Acidobacteria bacterium]|nr:MAG: hypothetical protein DMG40_01995 [Acidobacteriota bacterium]